ncbi:hypothetical protein COO60DRAFT_1518046 [Scenedesmus sp. NREL 46B-D3]|nr:hypothetical protein COO60DRAFT_1518046 [Scenedesmus sp. NREL 46B-D3]
MNMRTTQSAQLRRSAVAPQQQLVVARLMHNRSLSAAASSRRQTSRADDWQQCIRITARPAPTNSSRVCMAAAAAAAQAPSSSGCVDESRDFAIAMAKIADDTKAADLSVLHVEPLVSWCSYMVLCTVMSRPQLLAVLGRMEDTAQQEFDRIKQNQAGSSQWEVLDFGDVVVHVFTADQREHYDIDSFYAAAEEVPLSFLGEWQAGSSSSGSSSSAEVESSSSSGLGRSGPVWSKNF